MHNYRGLEVGSTDRNFVYGDEYREVAGEIELLSVSDGFYKRVVLDTFREFTGVEDIVGDPIYDGDVVKFDRDGQSLIGFVTEGNVSGEWYVCIDDDTYVLLDKVIDEVEILGHLWDGNRYD